jgi:hypothetical protein
MLEIQVPYKEGDVVSIKLSSGEEMIASLVKESDKEVVVRKPLMLVAGEGGMGLAPYMFTVSPEAKIHLKVNNVITVVKTAEDAAKMYDTQTSGIAI